MAALASKSELSYGERAALQEYGYRTIKPDALAERPAVAEAVQQILKKHQVEEHGYFRADYSSPQTTCTFKGNVVISNSMLELLNDKELTAVIANVVEIGLNMQKNEQLMHAMMFTSLAVGTATGAALHRWAPADKCEGGQCNVENKIADAETKPVEATPVEKKRMPRRDFMKTIATATGAAMATGTVLPEIAKKLGKPEKISLDYNHADLESAYAKISNWNKEHSPAVAAER